MATQVLHLTLAVRHPDCWTLKVTAEADANLLGHGAFTTRDGLVRGRFTVYGDTLESVESLIELARSSPLTRSVAEITESYEPRRPSAQRRSRAKPGNAAREIFVEYDSTNSIDAAFVERGFIYDGPTRIRDGVERWSLVTHHDRERVIDLLDEVREEMDAEIDVERLSMADRSPSAEARPLDRLSDRQREAFLLARRNGYYGWPRETTARELAAELGVSKTTYLEHLRKAEEKLLDGIT